MPVSDRATSPKSKIPLSVKLAYTAFMAVLIPIYLRQYGPTNFLWFCDTALLLTGAGIWFESPLLISMSAVGILIPQFFWLIAFGSHLLGFHILGLTDYMFDSNLPLFTRGLSLFHGWLPLVLLWLLSRVGYDTRALPAWTVLAAILIVVCYLLTPAPGSHLTNPNTPININNIYGFNDTRPQHWVNQNLFVAFWAGALWVGAYLPAHLVLKRIFAPAKPGPRWWPVQSETTEK
jgi:hypothetical protein